jgi:hypothetical protein
MRAATAIVGAIAVSSCLIALAFLLSGNSGSSHGTKSTRSPAPRQATEAPSANTTVEAGTAPAGELRQCGSGEASISVEGTSCGLGEKIQQAYQGGSREAITGADPETGQTITVTCGGTAPVICTGEGGVSIYFSH